MKTTTKLVDMRCFNRDKLCVAGSARVEKNDAGKFDVVVTLEDGSRHVGFANRETEKRAQIIAADLNAITE